MVDKQVIEDLFRRRRVALVGLARVMTGSTEVAEEVVQDAFLQLQRQAGPVSHPDAYLRTTVANMCRSHVRRLGVERRLAPSSRLVLENPELDELWAVVSALPVRQRAVLALRFYDDLPEQEIADILGCRLGTVKSSLHRGLAELRKRLL